MDNATTVQAPHGFRELGGNYTGDRELEDSQIRAILCLGNRHHVWVSDNNVVSSVGAVYRKAVNKLRNGGLASTMRGQINPTLSRFREHLGFAGAAVGQRNLDCNIAPEARISNQAYRQPTAVAQLVDNGVSVGEDIADEIGW